MGDFETILLMRSYCIAWEALRLDQMSRIDFASDFWGMHSYPIKYETLHGQISCCHWKASLFATSVFETQVQVLTFSMTANYCLDPSVLISIFWSRILISSTVENRRAKLLMTEIESDLSNFESSFDLKDGQRITKLVASTRCNG